MELMIINEVICSNCGHEIFEPDEAIYSEYDSPFCDIYCFKDLVKRGKANSLEYTHNLEA